MIEHSQPPDNSYERFLFIIGEAVQELDGLSDEALDRDERTEFVDAVRDLVSTGELTIGEAASLLADIWP